MRETASRPRQKTPAYRRHKPSNQGFVELNGRRLYLGRYDFPETVERYHRTIAEWLANGCQVNVDPETITVVELIARYWDHCKTYYARSDGSESSTLHNIRNALAPVRRLYGATMAKDFGPNALRTVRVGWVDAGLSRSTINGYVSECKRMFKWGVSHELIPAATYQALATLEGLRFGRSAAKENRIITPVSIEDVEKIRPFVSRQVVAMIDLQLLTGARSGEIAILRPCDFDTSGEVWTATPGTHKNEWRQKPRVLYFGPKAQAIVRPFLLRPADRHLFSPREAEAERHSLAPGHRRPHQKPNVRRTARFLHDHYDINSYRRAIQRACVEGGIAPWHPHQLRHTAATEVRKRYGLEAAALILGHARCDVTQVYAEIDQARALQIAAEVG